MFIAALCAIAWAWKQPQCPAAEEGIKNLWCIYIYIYIYNGILVIKRNPFESILMRWINLEPIIQSEVNQKEKIIIH